MRLRVILSILAPSILAAQPRVVRLGAFDSTPDVFSRIVAMRELNDGRVIIADRREVLLAAVSFDGTFSRRIGSVGSGAGQYMAAGPLLPMDGDSTALIDGAAGQWMLMRGSEPVDMVSPANLTVRAAHFAFAITPTHAYAYQLSPKGLGSSAHDTMALIRVSRRGAKIDTIAMVAAPTAGRSVDTSRSQVTVIHISIPTATMGEQAALFDDGWLAIARVRPYRVDWIDPVGNLHPGNALPNSPGDSTPPFTSFSEVLNDLSPALKRGPGGELLIRRYSSSKEFEQRYDVVDRGGQVVAQIVMPPRETLLGVGKAHVYTVRTGEDGKQRLRRYVWPLR